ncbi:hypothetical protein EPA93_31495 [Ktedonosporobacter rubrisoli]|uniref:Uncharacterized protein n=1 Tax=Ktedonosporobacter rubrisoli TaxID=2509675 RepID=A0A4P6JXX8_KTERU|nr:hypothetical protein [Ktedonosporobacter rubrisoli]QBD80260.1 hypothetical protein EPA93_31495 [Ktedonosporobacter rubrisoli]
MADRSAASIDALMFCSGFFLNREALAARANLVGMSADGLVYALGRPGPVGSYCTSWKGTLQR